MKKAASIAGILFLASALAACAIIAFRALSPYVSFTLQIVDTSNSPIPNATITSTPWDDPGKEVAVKQTADENGCIRISKAALGKHRVDVYDASESGWNGWFDVVVTKEMDESTFALTCGGDNQT